MITTHKKPEPPVNKKSVNAALRSVKDWNSIPWDYCCTIVKKLQLRIAKADAVNDLPQEFELEELLEKLVFVEKVETGLKQVESGSTISHNEVKEIVKTW